MIEAKKVTLYVRSEFLGNIKKLELKDFRCKVDTYAQYASAVHFDFKRPRDRLWRGSVESYKPSLLVLDGWGHPDPDAAFEVDPADPTIGVGRYSSCDDRWRSDFNAKIDAYIANGGVRVVADFRNHNPHAAKEA